jgi:hypothetical protein
VSASLPPEFFIPEEIQGSEDTEEADEQELLTADGRR